MFFIYKKGFKYPKKLRKKVWRARDNDKNHYSEDKNAENQNHNFFQMMNLGCLDDNFSFEVKWLKSSLLINNSLDTDLSCVNRYKG